MSMNSVDIAFRDYAFVRSSLLERREIALLDVREEDPHAQAHPLFAANFPLSRLELDAYAKCMVQNASWKLTIEGHADERGTTDYNLSLGQKRADAVRDYLQRLGVKGERSHTVSYGEEKPLDTASTEEAWEKNRRCELIAQ